MSEAGTMLGLREPLQRMVSRKFHEAYRNKDLLFSDTKLDVLRTKPDASVSQAAGCLSLSHSSHIPVSTALLPSISKEAPKGRKKGHKGPKIGSIRRTPCGAARCKHPKKLPIPCLGPEQVSGHRQPLHHCNHCEQTSD
jgi:hypothetical protein